MPNAAPPTLYDTERWNGGHITYTSPVLTSGRLYTVRLHFAERYVGAPNQRLFNISINGATSGPNYVADFDVFATAGSAVNKAVVRDFSDIAPDGITGSITVMLSIGSAQLPMLNGLEILAQPSALATFRATNSLPADGTHDTATPASDGVPNLLKFAFNMIGSGVGQGSTLATPNAATLAPEGTAGLPFGSLDNPSGKLKITYIRRKASSNSGITYTVEFSNDLGVTVPWAVNLSASETAVSLDASFERVTVTDSVISSKRFARMRISSH